MTTSTLAQQLREAKHVVVFTGAGASAESGISTFRDALHPCSISCRSESLLGLVRMAPAEGYPGAAKWGPSSHR